jgi:hypothetical protein
MSQLYPLFYDPPGWAAPQLQDHPCCHNVELSQEVAYCK